MNLILSPPENIIKGEIILEGSKSISNRLLIMRALSESDIAIENLSPSNDTTTLAQILSSNQLINDVGAAGTTMRFLIAYFSILDGERMLTGSERMKNRPVKILVDALRTLGADIQYLEKEGYPPLNIKGKKIKGGRIKVRADISSQYISALLMIGPFLENGLELELEGKISSRPYIQMTLKLMEQFGIYAAEKENIFSIYPGRYIFAPTKAESDWSAASYYFSICALSPGSEIKIKGLLPGSLQGDSVLPQLYSPLGVTSFFKDNVLNLKNSNLKLNEVSIDFSDCPDLAQTIAVTCAVLGIKGRFTGLESLKIKETDRTAALSYELKKLNVEFYTERNDWLLRGIASADQIISIRTYEDHRMAMSFAPLSLKLGKIIIDEPDVVNKSYPSFWSDLRSLGFSTSLA